MLEKNRSQNVATTFTTVIVFRRNACSLADAAQSVTRVRIGLVHTPTHLHMHGIQLQWKIITTNALKTTSKGDLVISTVGTVHPTPNFGPISLKKGPNFHSAPAVSASAAAAASSAASSPTPRDSTPPGSPSFSSPSPVATLVGNNKFQLELIQ